MNSKLRAWWFHRQGLDGSCDGQTAAQVFQCRGWARGVGGANPYLSVFARSGRSRSAVDQELAQLDILELPSARGCTYVLPANDFAVGLLAGGDGASQAARQTARKFLGFGDEDLAVLNLAILGALKRGPMDPIELKKELGDAVRHFGDEGKKRGQTTSLSLGLGALQAEGKIRRVSMDGRLDGERYKYALWSPGPLESPRVTPEEAWSELAACFFMWGGPATVAQFQWFSGLGVKAAKDLVAPLDLAEVAPGYRIMKSDLAAFEAFEIPRSEQIALLSPLDSLVLLKRNGDELMDPVDADRMMASGKGLKSGAGLSDIIAHLIVDRGRIIGIWEFDPEAGKIVSQVWVDRSKAIEDAIARTESFIKTDLGDCRSHSLDSPKSRRPMLDWLAANPGV